MAILIIQFILYSGIVGIFCFVLYIPYSLTKTSWTSSSEEPSQDKQELFNIFAPLSLIVNAAIEVSKALMSLDVLIFVLAFFTWHCYKMEWLQIIYAYF